MYRSFYVLFLTILCVKGVKARSKIISPVTLTDTIIIRSGLTNNQISREWENAISPRITKKRLDSVLAIRRPITVDEQAWINLFESKKNKLNLFRDSLENAFVGYHTPDTIYLLLGIAEGNDAFTYQNNTVCFDLEALLKLYGSAQLIENSERLDRLYAHEFTHLIHKEWARKNKVQIRSFKDSLLWECLYEGLGMYRSLSKKWMPQNGILPEITKNALAELYPLFVNNLAAIGTPGDLPADEKKRINSTLSNGPVAKKWGAFTVAIWLALEANGDDKKLVYWTEKGLDAVILLAKKYLAGENKIKFDNAFK